MYALDIHVLYVWSWHILHACRICKYWQYMSTRRVPISVPHPSSLYHLTPRSSQRPTFTLPEFLRTYKGKRKSIRSYSPAKKLARDACSFVCNFSPWHCPGAIVTTAQPSFPGMAAGHCPAAMLASPLGTLGWWPHGLLHGAAATLFTGGDREHLSFNILLLSQGSDVGPALHHVCVRGPFSQIP